MAFWHTIPTLMQTALDELALLQTENDQLNAQVVELTEQLCGFEEARDHHADFYDFVSVACLTLDRNGAIMGANRRTVSLVRYDLPRLLGAPFITLVVPEHRRQFLEHLAISNRGVDAVTLDMALVPCDGTPIPVRVTIRSERKLAGGYAVAVVDMRAIESAQAEQQRSLVAEREAQVDNQVKSRLITNLGVELRGLLSEVLRTGRVVSERSDLAHEIRTPLSELLQSVSSLRQRVIRLTGARIRPRERARQSRKLGGIRVTRLRALR